MWRGLLLLLLLLASCALSCKRDTAPTTASASATVSATASATVSATVSATASSSVAKPPELAPRKKDPLDVGIVAATAMAPHTLVVLDEANKVWLIDLERREGKREGDMAALEKQVSDPLRWHLCELRDLRQMGGGQRACDERIIHGEPVEQLHRRAGSLHRVHR